MEKTPSGFNPEYWGGIECTINRVHDTYFDQLYLSGHYKREDDIERIAALGIKKLRYPILWEKHQPRSNQTIDWTVTAKRLEQLEQHNITPIVGLLHHGSGPQFTSLDDDHFPELFANYAFEVANRFPSLQYYTPINEPLTTARFSGLYGLWYPHKKNDVNFAKMLLNQVKGIILAMKEIRKINPNAKLVQTEDLSKTYSTPSLAYQAAFENERRWLTYDLLCGKIQPGHVMWGYFTRLGIHQETLDFFIENPCPPDIMGFNYYITSERFLDDYFEKYPLHTHGGNELQEYADVEAIRVNHKETSGLTHLLDEAWQRFKVPIAITEAHLNAGREDQLRWLKDINSSCREAAAMGVNVQAITFWSLFGAVGWNKLLTSHQMDYEAGAFGVQGDTPRITAIGQFIKNVIAGEKLHTLSQQKGWWRQAHRYHIKETMENVSQDNFEQTRPVVIIGKTGTLGKAFAKICVQRNIPFILTGRDTLDITDEKNIQSFIANYHPWAIINTAGFVKVDEAEDSADLCFKINSAGPAYLAKACKERNVSFLTFSSDLVFDGKKTSPYYETDAVNPLNIYGASKAKAEEDVLTINADALVIRTSAFFGPWDEHNFPFAVLKSLSVNKKFIAADDVFISPTYLPHLVNTSLDLLIDDETGIWHLANQGAVTWKIFAEEIAIKAGYNPDMITGIAQSKINSKARRPYYSILSSKRGCCMPPLDNAINAFFSECAILPRNVSDSKTGINSRMIGSL